MIEIIEIAKNHIDEVRKEISSTYKYFIAIILLIICSWGFVTEPIFIKAKYNYIKKNSYKDKQIILLTENTQLNSKHKAISKFKTKSTRQDSLIRAEIYKVIEENIPKPFNSILRIAAFDNYGILIISITIFLFLMFLSNQRKEIIHKTSIALRIFKTNGGFNQAFDYNLSIPFWVFPIPNDSKINLKKDEFITVTGLKRNLKYKLFSILTIIIILIIIQLRLSYMSFITNSTLNWVTVLMVLLVFASVAITLIWFLPNRLDDSYNIEQKSVTQSRRNFLALSILFTLGATMSFFTKNIGSYIIESVKRPRFRKKTLNKKVSKCYNIEVRALELIKNKNLIEASNLIYQNLEIPKTDLLSCIRLFDLLIMLCYKNKTIYNNYYLNTIKLADQSEIPKLTSRISTWQNENNTKRKLTLKGKGIIWNKVKL